MDPVMQMLMSMAANMSRVASSEKPLDDVCKDMESKRDTWTPADESFYGLVSALRDFSTAANVGCDRLATEGRKAAEAMGDNVIQGNFGNATKVHGPDCIC